MSKTSQDYKAQHYLLHMKNKILIYLTAFLFALPQLSFAQIPFGGRIVSVHDCFCSGGWMMYIYDPSKLTVLPIVFQFGYSKLNANYNIWIPGVQTLGTYTLGGSCTIAATSCYVTVPAIGTVSPPTMPGIGTSLSPV